MNIIKNRIKVLLFATLMALTFSACNHVTTETLEEEVKQLFNENAKKEGSEVKATNVTLIKVDDTNYKGQITLTAEGEEEDFDINVIYDGRSFQYEIPELLDD